MPGSDPPAFVNERPVSEPTASAAYSSRGNSAAQTSTPGELVLWAPLRRGLSPPTRKRKR